MTQNIDRFKFRVYDPTRDTIIYDNIFIGHDNILVSNHDQNALHSSFKIIAMINKDSAVERKYLMQSTGLKDKNGKLIFEGDIIKWSGRKYKVHYQQYICSFRAYNENHNIIMDDDLCKNSEIIGNIYQNPELLSDNI